MHTASLSSLRGLLVVAAMTAAFASGCDTVQKSGDTASAKSGDTAAVAMTGDTGADKAGDTGAQR